MRGSYLTVSNDKMKMECKRNGALWIAGGSMAGGGFALHGFSLYLKGPGKVIKCQFLKILGNLRKIISIRHPRRNFSVCRTYHLNVA